MTWGRMVPLAVAGLIMSGCVMAEKYEAERARAMNFQRLLAQEEKRTGELDSELKRVKRDATDLEGRNRELQAQVQAVREQLGRMQEEAAAMRDAALLKEREAATRARKPSGKGKALDKPMTDLGDPGSPFGLAPEPAPVPPPDAMAGEMGQPRYHQVKPGDTLFGISRRYGLDVKTLKQMNNLQSNAIEVGQRLIVGR